MDPLITIELVPISIEYVEKQTNTSPNRRSHSTNLDIPVKSNQRVMAKEIIDTSVDSYKTTASSNSKNIAHTFEGYPNNNKLYFNTFLPGQNIRLSNVARGIDSILDIIRNVQSAQSYYGFDSVRIHHDINIHPIGSSELVLKVVESPKVIVKYIGGPIYIQGVQIPTRPPENEEFKKLTNQY